MKKTISVLLLFATLALCLASCGGNPGKTTASETTPSATTPPTTTAGNYMEAYIGFPYHDVNVLEYASIPRSAYVSFAVSMDVTDEDVDEYIAELLRENPIEITVTDRAIKEGDVVYLYYEGSVDGELFDGGSNMQDADKDGDEDEEPYPLEIGSGSFIPGFEEALVGMIPADTLSTDTYIDVTFPTDYTEELAGKAARFRVQITAIVDGYEDRTELTPEFLAELGYETEESDVIAAFRATLLEEMRQEIVAEYDTILREHLLSLVSDSLSVTKLPESELTRQKELYTEEIEYYFDYYNYMSNLYYGYDAFASVDEFAVAWLGLEEGADWAVEVERLASEKIKRTLLLYAIAENEAITVSQTRFNEVLAELAVEYDMEASEIITAAGADIVYDEAIYFAVTDLLIARATVDNGDLPLETE